MNLKNNYFRKGDSYNKKEFENKKGISFICCLLSPSSVGNILKDLYISHFLNELELAQKRKRNTTLLKEINES